MRILYCNKYNFPFSGTEAYLFEAMELMRSQGHEVALFSMEDARGKPTPYDRHFVSHVDFKRPRQGMLRRARLAGHAIYSQSARTRLRRLLHEFRPDVAHVRNIYHHLSPSILWELRSHHVPVVYHLNDFKLLCPSYNMVSHGHACERCRNGQFWRIVTEGCYAGSAGEGALLAAEAYVHRWARTYDKCVDLFLAPSHFVRDKLVENGWDAKRIEVLPHFQKLPIEGSPEPAADAPILYFGRLSPEKGLTDLLRAMRRLPAIKLQIAGDGPQKEELDGLAQQLGLSNVSFVGHVEGEGLQALIAASRFTVLPTRAYETLGKTILESYALGRAVVATDLGSRRELLKEGETGVLYRAGDIEQLAAAISFLHERPVLAAEMGKAGRDIVRREHTPESHYAVLSDIYRRLARTVPLSRVVPAPRKLKIAFIGGRGVVSKYSGIEAYYEEVGKRLAALGHEVTAYCRTHFTPPAETHEGMRLVRLPTIRSKHLETVVHTLLSSVHAAFSHYDIVHYHALGPALFSFVPRVGGAKTIVTVQGLDWQRKKWGRAASWVLRLGERAAVRLPDATVVVSRTLQQYFRDRYAAETICIPNGTVLRKAGPIRYLDGWGLLPNQYILFLGRFSPEKNCHLLVEAFERIETHMRLVLAGGSSYSDGYARQLRRHDSDRVRVLNWLSGDALNELLTHAALFVLPSDLEGLSLALLDAMGAGICVLTSDVPENRELVDGAGFTFRSGDVDDLERMLRLLINDPEVREQAAGSGRQRVQTGYLWPKIAKQIETSYLQLMGWTKPSPEKQAEEKTEVPQNVA